MYSTGQVQLSSQSVPPPGPSGTEHIKYTLEPLLASNPYKSFQQTGCDADNAISLSKSGGLSLGVRVQTGCERCRLQAFVLAVSKPHDIDTARTFHRGLISQAVPRFQ